MDVKLIAILLIHQILYTLADKPTFIPVGKPPPKNDKPVNRVINGFTPGEFDNPHVVLLEARTAQGTTLICTGSLISSLWVMTAGHCGQNAIEIQVQLGLYNRNNEPPQTIIVPENNIFIHPNYFSNNGTAAINDLALLRLNPRANTLLRGIKTIPMACPIAGNFAGRIGRVCGWGITSDNATDIPIILQCVDMPVITNSECTRTWGAQVRSTNICTRTVNFRTACHGDSGGPLLVIDGLLRRRKLVGAVSFGTPQCAGTSPDVFTRITSYNSWITRTTGILCDLF